METYIDRCPVCGKKIVSKYYTDYGHVCEEHEKCDRCGYKSEFAYGNYRTYIDGKEFIWSYNTTKVELSYISKKMIKLAWKVQKRLRRLGRLNGRCRICL